MNQARSKPRFWPIARRLFRWFRIGCLLILLAAVCSLIYLDSKGLPDFVKSRLLDELRARGMEAEFDRVRLHWYRGLVVENLHFKQAGKPDSPRFFAQEAGVDISQEALRSVRFEVGALHLKQGRFVLPLLASNAPPKLLSLENIGTELRFLPDDRWQLAGFQARLLDMQVNLSGEITNASHFRQWQLPRREKPEAEGIPAWHGELRRAVAFLEQTQFSGDPELRIQFHGDASRADQFGVDLRLHAGEGAAAWGRVEDLLLSIPVRSVPGSNGSFRGEINIAVGRAQTPWGTVDQARVKADFLQAPTNALPLEVEVDMALRQPKTKWGSATRLKIAVATTQAADAPGTLRSRVAVEADFFKSQWANADRIGLTGALRHAISELMPRDADLSISSSAIDTRWGKAAQLSSRLKGESVEGAMTPEDWGPWRHLAPFALEIETRLAGVSSPELEADEFQIAGNWKAPELRLSKIAARLYEGSLDAAASLNVETRVAQAEGTVNFDIHQVSELLTPKARKWISQYSWEKAPKASSTLRAILPEWINPKPDWKNEVQPTLEMAGRFEAERGAFRGVGFDAASSRFTLTNLTWHLPDLELRRDDGEASLVYTGHMGTQDYHWHIHSRVDPKILRPLLETEEQERALAFLEFSTPPEIKGQVWGRWHEQDLIGAVAEVAATNFTFRGKEWSRFSAAAQYTNLMVQVTNIHVRRGGEWAKADGIAVDLKDQRIYFTNGLAVMDPLAVTDVIGPKVSKAIEPYKFSQPPTVKVNGSLPFPSTDETDLRFDVAGGPFKCLMFNAANVSANLLWVKDTLTVTNVQGVFYDGRLEGNAFFDFQPGGGADFRFQASVADISVNGLMNDIATKTNRAEGRLTGRVNVTSAHTDDWASWQGSGQAQVKEGHLWDIPLFGVFSPMLNTVAPGLGSSKVSEAAATFIITNGVAHSKDLELRSAAMRLKYDGAIAFDGSVNARVEAELFRDAWLVGRIFSLALTPFTKMFEYRVTGTIQQPKTEPLHIPKYLLIPFQPFRAIKELLPGEQQEPEKGKEPNP